MLVLSPGVFCLEIQGLVLDIEKHCPSTMLMLDKGSCPNCAWVRKLGQRMKVCTVLRIRQSCGGTDKYSMGKIFIFCQQKLWWCFLTFEEEVIRNHTTHQNNCKCVLNPLLCLQIREIDLELVWKFSDLWCPKPWTLSSVEFGHQEQRVSFSLTKAEV